jgi:hypothetical protein
MPSFDRFSPTGIVPAENTPVDPAEGLKGKPGAPIFGGIDITKFYELMRAMPLTNNDVLTVNHRCGRDGWKPHTTNGWNTETADILAGESVGFRPETYAMKVRLRVLQHSRRY